MLPLMRIRHGLPPGRNDQAKFAGPDEKEILR
jgi:hypothetical protein